MTTHEKTTILKTVTIFSDVPEEDLELLAAICESKDFDAHECVFEENDLGKSLYIIISGSCSISKGGTQLAVLKKLDVFGELAALDPERRSATVTALEPMKTFIIHQHALYEIMSRNTAVSKAVISVLCTRIRKIEKGIVD